MIRYTRMLQEPVSYTMFLQHARVFRSDDREIIEQIISAARAEIEMFLTKTLHRYELQILGSSAEVAKDLAALEEGQILSATLDEVTIPPANVAGLLSQPGVWVIRATAGPTQTQVKERYPSLVAAVMKLAAHNYDTRSTTFIGVSPMKDPSFFEVLKMFRTPQSCRF